MAFLTLFFLLRLIKLAVALFVAFTKEGPVANIFLSVIEKMCFIKLYFVGIFGIFSPSLSQLLLTSQKCRLAGKNFRNARPALQKNLAPLAAAANHSAYCCSHIITADIKISLNVWTEESDIPLRPARDYILLVTEAKVCVI